MIDLDIASAITRNVAAALEEDIGKGDFTAQLIPANQAAHATLITREKTLVCGRPWFDACFLTLDPKVDLHWHFAEGESVPGDAILCEVNGNARAILSAERPAMNFLQLLSGVANVTQAYVAAVRGTRAQIMDTRKTLPGLRIAQKYAVQIGGGSNQRMGLFDGILIKENHIAAAGGIAPVLNAARALNAGVGIQIEVENVDELQQALAAQAALILLDNFSVDTLRMAVQLTQGRAILEASGGITLDNVRAIAETGVDRISIGGLTKHVRAVDLSLRVQS